MISTSKIRKITANKKKRMEKGDRVYHEGSKPHSKGEFFSRFILFLNIINDLIINKITLRIIRNNANREKEYISIEDNFSYNL